jgi:hypothetical protein
VLDGRDTDYVVETWPPEPLVTERLVLRDQPSVRINADQLNGLMGQYYELELNSVQG